MRAKRSYVIVVDSSVVRAFGGPEATFPDSKNCRDFCTTMLRVCHHAILTPDIKEEWQKHASSFARTWLRSMVARRKFHYLDEDSVYDSNLRERLRAFARTANEWEAMEKDCRILEASLATDNRIASLDENARSLFARASGKVGALKGLLWVNPAQDADAKIEWLESGAPDRRAYRLG